HVAVVAAGRFRRVGAGFHPGVRHLRGARPRRWHGRNHDRQRDQAAVPRSARLAVRVGSFDRADRERARADRARGPCGAAAPERNVNRAVPVWIWTSALAAYLFLYLPLLVVVVFSFNDSKLNAEWVGFTTAWYAKLFRNGEMLIAARNSLLIALVASIVSTFLGTMAGFALHKSRMRVLPGLGGAPLPLPG